MGLKYISMDKVKFVIGCNKIISETLSEEQNNLFLKNITSFYHLVRQDLVDICSTYDDALENIMTPEQKTEIENKVTELTTELLCGKCTETTIEELLGNNQKSN
jgi:CRISPR/Cas system Type II protein with McrA/HNH and RuvC-like nuclease domain